MTLRCMSSGRRRRDRCGEGAVELAGDVPLEAAADLALGLAFGGAALDVAAGAGATAHSCHRDGVDGSVQGPVAAAVEAVVAGGLAAAGRDRRDAAEPREGRLVAQSLGVVGLFTIRGVVAV